MAAAAGASLRPTTAYLVAGRLHCEAQPSAGLLRMLWPAEFPTASFGTQECAACGRPMTSRWNPPVRLPCGHAAHVRCLLRGCRACGGLL